MRKFIVCVAFFLFGFFVYLFILSGMHGRIKFRYWMIGDWIFYGLMVLFWGIPFFIIAKSIFKKIKSKRS